MSFPNSPFPSITSFMDAYGHEHAKALAQVSRSTVTNVARLFEATYLRHATLFVCGNGGSAAIANHMVCDHGKLIGTDTTVRVRIQSLCNSNELMTAVANDISYDEVFSFPLRSMAQPGDVLLTISGSGQSPNIVRAVEAAKSMGLATVAFTGFTGGKSGQMSDFHVHVPSDNYGIIEDIHQSLMQIIAQFIRMSHMDPHLVSERRF